LSWFSTEASGTDITLDKSLENGIHAMARAPQKRKVYLGKITNYFTKLNVAEIKLENGDLNRGDTILIIGPTTGAIEYALTR